MSFFNWLRFDRIVVMSLWHHFLAHPVGLYKIICCSSAKLELVDKFCYLGDMLSVDGDADAAVEARIRIG